MDGQLRCCSVGVFAWNACLRSSKASCCCWPQENGTFASFLYSDSSPLVWIRMSSMYHTVCWYRSRRISSIISRGGSHSFSYKHTGAAVADLDLLILPRVAFRYVPYLSTLGSNGWLFSFATSFSNDRTFLVSPLFLPVHPSFIRNCYPHFGTFLEWDFVIPLTVGWRSVS